jgi:hypothetical protein
MTKKKFKTHLFSRPSFIDGMARIFDFSGSLQKYNTEETPQEADYIALRNDWRMVGEDIRKSIEQYAFIRRNNAQQ